MAQLDQIAAKLDLVLAEMEQVRRDVGRLARKINRQKARTKKRPSNWRPQHDYAGDWNAMAERHGWRTVQRITPKRARLLKEAESSDAWDWPALLAEVDQVARAWVDGFRGWGFDWVVGDEEHWTNIMERKYRPDNGNGGKTVEDFFND